MIISGERKRGSIRHFGSWIVICVLISAAACIKIQNEYSVIPPGIWRAELDLTAGSISDAETFDERSQGQLPFNFAVIYDTQDSLHIEIINGTERIVVTDITYGRDVRTGRDTIQINFP
ncbi:MAG: hypothetical protein R3330_16125, partial [Saprospiraceae bacterium]|nr:hypothetical protein [Saprospiraceae bacterium]